WCRKCAENGTIEWKIRQEKNPDSKTYAVFSHCQALHNFAATNPKTKALDSFKSTLLQNLDYKERCDISYLIDAREITAKTEFLERPLTEKNGSFGALTFCRLDVMENFIRVSSEGESLEMHRNLYSKSACICYTWSILRKIY
ncbi:unnamed protein product, partial [Angiostrongylus costaricensis]|uniref:Dimer_Tnp_hAT domain-containing protein n=1 Tax=Angiostrongylus costaricensis TaxID=334426 RepID=A0A0R3PC66_ANGCS